MDKLNCNISASPNSIQDLIKLTRKIQDDIYCGLDGQPVTVERMADLLKPYCRTMNTPELASCCNQFYLGILKGEYEAELCIEKGEPSDTERTIWEYIKRMPSRRRKDVLVELCCVLKKGRGDELTSETMASMQGISDEKLVDQAVELIETEGNSEGRYLLLQLAERADNVAYEVDPQAEAFRSTYDEKENAWIAAAGSFAAMYSSGILEKEEKEEICYQIGYKTGYVFRTAERVVKAAAGGAATASGVALTAATIMKGEIVFEVIEAAAAGSGLFTSGSLAPVIIASTVGSIGIVAALTAGIVFSVLGAASAILAAVDSGEEELSGDGEQKRNIDSQETEYVSGEETTGISYLVADDENAEEILL